MQQGWYAGITIPLHWVLLCHFTNLFIALSYQDNFVYSFVIPGQFCLYQSVIDFLVYTILLFIGYTSAPVEVSVWLGGITQKSVYCAFCVQDAVPVE